MKQKIVIGMSMHDDKCRSRALKVAVCIPGVESAAVMGEERDQVVVIGEGVDSVELTQRLRKKMGRAELLSVGDANISTEPPAAAAEPPVVGMVAPPCYGVPRYHHCEVREEPACFSPCCIL